jgi:YggT family protein
MIAAVLFLIETLFGLYLTILSVRLILAYEHANYFNPITRFIITVTQPIIHPMRRILPNIGRLEVSTLVLICIVVILKLLLIMLIVQQYFPIPLFLYIVLKEVINLILKTFFYAILIFAILSWVHIEATPLMQVLSQLSAPILRPLQKIIPPISGFDISPLVALILIQVLMIFI